MSYSKMIHEYMDGDLSGMEEDILFSELASDPELRDDFNQQMKLEMATKSDMNSITTPAQCTNAIFSSLGFSVPSTDYAEASASESTSKVDKTGNIIGFWKKHFNVMISGLSSVAVAALVFGLSSNAIVEEAQQESLANNNSIVAQKTSIPVVSSFAQEDKDIVSIENSVKDNKAINTIIQDTDNDKEDASDSEDIIVDDNLSVNTSNALSIKDIAMSDIEVSESIYHPDNSIGLAIVGIKDNYSRDILSDEFNKFTFTIARSSASSMMDLDLAGSNSEWYAGMGITMMYDFNKSFSLGLGLGTEHFGQKFSAMDGHGNMMRYQQVPLLMYYGAVAQYKAHEIGIEGLLTPYISAFAGGTSSGPLGKLQLGLQLAPHNNIVLSFAVEGSSLFYNVQGTNYRTDKIGFTGGLSFRF